MAVCRFCGKPLQQEKAVCVFCGYDPNTDTLSPDFHPETKAVRKQRKKLSGKDEKADQQVTGGINPRVKNFALLGLVLVAFSIFYKYNFNLQGVVFEVSRLIDKLNVVKFVKTQVDKNKDRKNNENLELINVKSYEQLKVTQYKDLTVEGILFDPAGKSFVTINGKVISEGERIEMFTVKRIRKDSVEFLINGETTTLRMNQSIPLPKK